MRSCRWALPLRRRADAPYMRRLQYRRRVRGCQLRMKLDCGPSRHRYKRVYPDKVGADDWRMFDHSFRSAVIGSTPAARRAGIAVASSAAMPSISDASASMPGSQGFTPNS